MNHTRGRRGRRGRAPRARRPRTHFLRLRRSGRQYRSIQNLGGSDLDPRGCALLDRHVRATHSVAMHLPVEGLENLVAQLADKRPELVVPTEPLTTRRFPTPPAGASPDEAPGRADDADDADDSGQTNDSRR